MKLFRLFAPVLLALALPLCGCASTIDQLTGATVSQKTAGAAVAAYNVAEAAANVYLALPICANGQGSLANACRTVDVSTPLNAALDKGDAAADTLLVQIDAAQKAGTGIGIASAAVGVLEAATSKVKSATPVG